MKKKTAWTLALLSLTIAQAAADPPERTSRFYGAVTAEDAAIPSGTVVSAEIDGIEFQTSEVFDSSEGPSFRLDVPGDLPETPAIEGGFEGQPVVFKVNGSAVPQTALWHDGTYSRLDLTAPVGPDLAVTLDDGRTSAAPGADPVEPVIQILLNLYFFRNNDSHNGDTILHASIKSISIKPNRRLWLHESAGPISVPSDEMVTVVTLKGI